MSALSTQIGGNHYKDMKIQPVQFIVANNIPFIEGNIIKYICRYTKKGGLEDIKKVRHYLDLLEESIINDREEEYRNKRFSRDECDPR